MLDIPPRPMVVYPGFEAPLVPALPSEPSLAEIELAIRQLQEVLKQWGLIRTQ